MLTRSSSGPGSPARGLLPRGSRFQLTLPLCRTTGTWGTSSGDVTRLSLLHDECDVVDNLQPLGVMIWNSNRHALLPISHVGTIPPGETQNKQERPLRTTRKNVGPCRRAMRCVLSSPAPPRLNCFPPPGHLGAEAGNRKVVASRGLMGILEIFFDLRRPVLLRNSCSL